MVRQLLRNYLQFGCLVLANVFLLQWFHCKNRRNLKATRILIMWNLVVSYVLYSIVKDRDIDGGPCWSPWNLELGLHPVLGPCSIVIYYGLMKFKYCVCFMWGVHIWGQQAGRGALLWHRPHPKHCSSTSHLAPSLSPPPFSTAAACTTSRVYCLAAATWAPALGSASLLLQRCYHASSLIVIVCRGLV
jgi:hypothetical protein